MDNKLWAVSALGNVYTLSKGAQEWIQVPSRGLILSGFKKISAGPQCVWALACDHQVFVYVPSSDLPIRCKESTFENERWVPTRSWSGNHLIPAVDPAQWSTEDGNRPLPRTDFKLPSHHWQWESDWYVDENVDGHQTDKGGWRYGSLDFQHKFTHQKTMKSCVRRRKWIRYREYVATNTWARIASIHVDPLEEPVVDVAVGGFDLPYQPEGFVLVWIVTINGRLLYRNGVSRESPEGTSWEVVSLGEEEEVQSVATGPTGMVWVLTWAGTLLARTGVSLQNPKGSGWVSVDVPEEEDHVQHIAVGTNAVWVSAASGKVCFRKGVKASQASTDISCATGNGWVTMVHKMNNLSIAPNDQLFGIDSDERQIYFRSGITSDEQTGKVWCQIDLPHKPCTVPIEHSDSVASSLCSSLSMDQLVSDTLNSAGDKAKPGMKSSSIDQNTVMKEGNKNTEQAGYNGKDKFAFKAGFAVSFKSSSNAVNMNADDSEDDEEINTDKLENVERNSLPAENSGILLSDTVVTCDSISEGLDSITLDNPVDLIKEDETDILWTSVSSSACMISDESQIRSWLSTSKGGSTKVAYGRSISIGRLRHEVLSRLRERNSKQIDPFKNYDLAIERSVWSKKGELRWFCDTQRLRKWVKVSVELSQDTDPDSKDGTFTLQYEHLGQHKHISIPLEDIVGLTFVDDPISSLVSGIYTTENLLPLSSRCQPVKISASTEEELEDWVSALSVTCGEQRGLGGGAHPMSAWATTERGDIFLHEPERRQNTDDNKAANMYWHQVGGHLAKVETCPSGVTWGIGIDQRPWVYSGGFGGGFFKGMASSSGGIYVQTDKKDVYIYENQRWRPVLGFTDKVLLNDRYTWSDETGKIECSKENTKLPSRYWHWTTDWQVDFKIAGGTDKEGWQYAYDFNRQFRSRPRLRSYVRRRRWSRQCKIVTTGPWEEIGPLPLVDISIQVDLVGSDESPLAVWAIGANGDVLCRSGVTKLSPKGISWVHVPTDQPMSSVTVGGSLRVWATGRDGSAWYRHGVSDTQSTGTCWYHVPPPAGISLRQISAGDTEVYAVDKKNKLWKREGISTKSFEGTTWVQICPKVRHVSVGAADQVWGIVEDVPCKGGNINGVVSIKGPSHEKSHKPKLWDHGIGGNWKYVTNRGWLQ